MSKQYKAVMLVQLEIHEVDDKGQCTGKPLTSVDLAKFGLKPKVVMTTKPSHKTGLLKALAKKFKEITGG